MLAVLTASCGNEDGLWLTATRPIADAQSAEQRCATAIAGDGTRLSADGSGLYGALPAP